MPDLIVSCDWSISPRKRWLAAAKLSAGASYEIAAPVQVDRIDDFFSTLRVSAPTGAILAGFDFPIGVPRHYVRDLRLRGELRPSLLWVRLREEMEER